MKRRNEMITDFKESNRIILFRDLTYDEIKKEIDERKFEDILLDKYDEFVAFCEKVEHEGDRVKSITSYYAEGELQFEVKYKD